VLFVDVREQQDYLARHIHGAISVPPLHTLEARYQELPRERLIVLYCVCPHSLAMAGFRQLHAKGYRNLRVLDEGLPGWITQGDATEGVQAAPRVCGRHQVGQAVHITCRGGRGLIECYPTFSACGYLPNTSPALPKSRTSSG
jgi:rhodanese-related sulfurtransferase